MKRFSVCLSLLLVFVLLCGCSGSPARPRLTPLPVTEPTQTPQSVLTAQPEPVAVDPDTLWWNEAGEWMGWYAADLPEDTPSVPLDGTAPTVPSEAQWTVLFYICGGEAEAENGAASAVLAEILAAKCNASVNLLVETGGTTAWQLPGMDTQRLQRFAVAEDALAPVASLPPASMGDPDTLTDFIAWGTTQYPAKRYALILWGEGGEEGVLRDAAFGGDVLTLSDLSKGIGNTAVSLELIGFDTDGAATLENAGLLSSYARYMVAAEGRMACSGWNYTGALNALTDRIGSTGGVWGRAVCDTYLEKCRREGVEAAASLSLIDLASVNALRKAFNGAAEEMTAALTDPSALTKLLQAAAQARRCGDNRIDLLDLARKTEAVLPQTAAGLEDALDRAVVYAAEGAYSQGLHGLSVFFPLSADSETCNAYAGGSVSSHYLRLLSALTGWDASPWGITDVPSLSPEDYAAEATLTGTGDGGCQLTDTGKVLVSADIRVLVSLRDGTPASLGTWHLYPDTDGVAVWENPQSWPSVEGILWPAERVYTGEASVLYSLPVLLQGKEACLAVAYLTEEERFVLYGVWDAGRGLRKLSAGDSLQPLYFGEDGMKTSSGQTVTVSESLRITAAPLPEEATFLCTGTDIFRRKVPISAQ